MAPPFNFILTFALLLLLSPFAFALPTAAADALEIYKRNASNLAFGWQPDYTGQIACIPTNDMHICLVRSTQFPTQDTVVTIFDPWCNLVGIRDGKVETIPDVTLSVGVVPWARTVEVTWNIPLWIESPEGWYWGVHWGGWNDPKLVGTRQMRMPLDCRDPFRCAYVSWLVPFRC